MCCHCYMLQNMLFFFSVRVLRGVPREGNVSQRLHLDQVQVHGHVCGGHDDREKYVNNVL